MSDQRETTAKCCRVGQGADTAYGSSLRRLARALSLPLDGVTAIGEVATARQPLQTPVATVEAGTLGPPLHRSARIALAHNNGGPTAVLAVPIPEGPRANGE